MSWWFYKMSSPSKKPPYKWSRFSPFNQLMMILWDLWYVIDSYRIYWFCGTPYRWPLNPMGRSAKGEYIFLPFISVFQNLSWPKGWQGKLLTNPSKSWLEILKKSTGRQERPLKVDKEIAMFSKSFCWRFSFFTHRSNDEASPTRLALLGRAYLILP